MTGNIVQKYRDLNDPESLTAAYVEWAIANGKTVYIWDEQDLFQNKPYAHNIKYKASRFAAAMVANTGTPIQRVTYSGNYS